MNPRAYRWLRNSAGLASLAACTLAFADIGGWLPAVAARVMLWLQWTPSLLGTLRGAGWLAAGFVAVIALTLVCGRVYCSMICPLGVLMDLAARAAGRTGRKRKLPYAEGWTWLRVTVVVACVTGVLLSTAMLLGMVDPYSVFGRIVAGTLRPLEMWINHGLTSLGWAKPLVVSPVSWTAGSLAGGLLVVVVGLAIWRGRIWCNTLCPVGAVLGFFAKFAWFRLRIASSQCAACSMCERVCPSQCIDFRNHRIDHSRCVMCLECVSSCRKNGIGFARGGNPLPVPDRKAKDMPSRASTVGRCDLESALPSPGRRALLGLAAAVPAVALAEGLTGKDRYLDQHNKKVTLPPGARGLAHFRSHCTACHLCVAHCPEQVLVPAVTRHGLAGFLQPFQDFDIAFCSYNCSNCSQICPTGAIRPLTVEERRTVQAGVARLFDERCVVHAKGTSCGACSEHCPTQAVRMVPFKDNLTAPEVVAELCIGCGGCEYICPVRPAKAILVEGLEIHRQAKKVDRGKANTVRKMEEEFPF